MKQLIVVVILIVGGVLMWQLGSRLSDDALGMAVGLLFGVLAGLPPALLVLAANRRPRYDDDEEMYERYRRLAPPQPQQPFPYQPPVIVLAGVQMPRQTQYPPAQQVDEVGYPLQERIFKVVGEREEDEDEFPIVYKGQPREDW